MNGLGLLLDLVALQSQAQWERGIPRYVVSQARELLRVPGAVRRLFLSPLAPAPVRLDPNLSVSTLLAWNSVTEMEAALAEGPSALYMMSPFDSCESTLQYLPARVPLIVTLYDLIPLLHPEKYLRQTAEQARYHRKIEILKHADLVLAISESTRQDAITHLKLSPGRVAVIGAGVDARFKPARPGVLRPPAPFRALGLDAPYLMTVLGDDFRKNLQGLLEAVRCLPPELGRDLRLLVVGRYTDDSVRRYRAMSGARVLGDRLIFSGRISDDRLIALYQGAALHVFPSLYEGFGFPAAEAAACGCPSITSNTSSLPEVLNMPEATFNPASPEEMAARIARGLTDTDFRNQLIEQGIERAREHSWQRVAQRTIEAISAVEGPLRRRVRLRSVRKPRLALVGPMPPAHSGVADYNERICSELQRRCQLDVFLSDKDSAAPATLTWCRCYRTASLRDLVNPAAYDAILYTFGNSEHHLDTYAVCHDYPGWVWLHDVRLYGLLTRYAQECLPPPHPDDFMQWALKNQYGPRRPMLTRPSDSRDLAFLRDRDIGFLSLIVQHARGIIVHSAHAEQLLRRDLPPGMALPPVKIVPLAFPQVAADAERESGPPWVIAHFGLVDPLKRPELLIRAFASLKSSTARLVFVGHGCGDYIAGMKTLAASLGIDSRVTFTGRVPAEEYDAWIRRSHLAVQIRASSNGESSAAINDLVSAGTPVITNMCSTADWPCGTITRVSAAASREELCDAMERLLEPAKLAAQAATGMALAAEHSFARVTDQLLAAIGVLGGRQ